jgi:hypothetical protein
MAVLNDFVGTSVVGDVNVRAGYDDYDLIGVEMPNFLAEVERFLFVFFATYQNRIVGAWLTSSQRVGVICGGKDRIATTLQDFSTQFTQERVTPNYKKTL